jgi:hypothetical protein
MPLIGSGGGVLGGTIPWSDAVISPHGEDVIVMHCSPPCGTSDALRQCRHPVCFPDVALMTRFLRLAIALAAAAYAAPAFAASGIGEIWHRTHWGEFSDELLQQFGAEATGLPRSLDFGDSYVDVVLPSQVVGGAPMVVFFQMDKATHGLKRIQLERPRHGVNPPAFRAILAALRSDFGTPDQMCVVPARPAGGYQAAAEELWLRRGAVVSAIFRDTTLEAFEGCLFGPANGTCGLTGQLLVRIGPPGGDGDPCSLR